MMQQQHQQPLPPNMWPQQHAPSQMMQPVQQPQQYAGAGTPASSDEIRSLWIGDLQYWMDETYVSTCFYNTGEFGRPVYGDVFGQQEETPNYEMSQSIRVSTGVT